jgi:hypothetical protein
MSLVGDQNPSDQQTSQPPKRHWKAEKPFSDLRASHCVEIFLTIALLFVGISQLCVYLRQASIMKKQAAISEQQLALSQAVERPFITISDFKVEPTYDDENKIIGWAKQVTIENSGNTPTKNMELRVGGSEANLAFPEEIYTVPRDPDSGAWPPIFQRDILGPKAKRIYASGGIADANVAQMMASNQTRLQIAFGAIRYKSSFSTNEYITKFCFFISNPIRHKDGTTTFTQESCRHWNCADDECAIDKNEWEADMANPKRPHLRQ